MQVDAAGMSDYNGWTNWETWNAHLWLSNEPGSDDAAGVGP